MNHNYYLRENIYIGRIILDMYNKESFIECNEIKKQQLERICLIAGVEFKNNILALVDFIPSLVDFKITIKSKKELDRIFPTLYDNNLVDSKFGQRS